ncbi:MULTISPECIES: hypothetical protein [unclassified Campylobacter]|uniref:hypothetical protein n=1 Tax=unclassified Campylobacter TaxID=2593542 RepID=UPI003D34AD5A
MSPSIPLTKSGWCGCAQNRSYQVANRPLDGMGAGAGENFSTWLCGGFWLENMVFRPDGLNIFAPKFIYFALF